ncbi:MAG: hypothetical protein QM820_00855 [Minicystis sp.]
MLVRFLRSAGWVACALAAVAFAPPALAADRTVLFTDHDDDDADGTPDDEQARVPRAPELFTIAHPSPIPAGASFTIAGDAVRLLADGVPLAAGATIPKATARLELQAVRAGRAEVTVLGRTVSVGAVEVRAIDGDGHEVDLARSHASMQRTPPDRLGDDPFADGGDPDAVRFVVQGFADDLPATLNLVSLSTEGQSIDALTDVPLGEVPCKKGTPAGITCASTRPIRAVADDIDRAHPLVADRSLKVELGGAVAVASASMEKLQMIRVAGPRRSPVGAIGRHRAALRLFLVRLAPKGAAPVGGSDAAAIEIARGEVDRANAMWGACGFSFGPARQAEIRVVDPPRAHMLALGCDHGLPASGGALRVRVDGREVTAKIAPGLRPSAAARVVAAAIGKAGFDVRISDNPAIGAGAFGTSDLIVRKRGGQLATVEPPARGPLIADATLTACIGRVDLEDGLSHFGDVDAVAGTVEERALIKAFDDGDPATIEVFLVPTFAGGGRIGESFIAADAGALRNLLVEDRAGIRADRASFALAHELGHVLLDDPGHPDDWGIDTPTRLMDADAANPSAFGPRRITVGECARALRQSGPGAPVPILRPWPLRPLGR